MPTSIELMAECVVQVGLAASDAIERTLGDRIPQHLRGKLFWSFHWPQPTDKLPNCLIANPSNGDPEGDEAVFASAVARWCGGDYFRADFDLFAIGTINGIEVWVIHPLNPDFPDMHEASIASQVQRRFAEHARAVAEAETQRKLDAEAEGTVAGIEALTTVAAHELHVPCAAADLFQAVLAHVNERIAARLGEGYGLTADRKSTVPDDGAAVTLLTALPEIVENVELQEVVVEHSCEICQPR